MIAPLALLASAALHCQAEDARYRLRGHPEIVAEFRAVARDRDWTSGLALGVTSNRPGAVTTWWLPWLGGTDNLQHIASTTDVTAPGWRPPDPDGGVRPLGDRQFIGVNADYDVIDLPRRGGPAPEHILIPDAGSSHDPVFTAKQFFDLASCRPGRG